MRCRAKLSIGKLFFGVIISLLMAGCSASRVVVKKNFNFSSIKKVAVLKFSGSGGEAVSNEIIRQLLGAGIGVVDRTDSLFIQDLKSLDVDAVISGSVVEFNPSSKLLVFKDKGNLILTDRTVPISGTTVLPSVNAFGLEDANVFSVSASVSVSAKMLHAHSGEVVWSDSRSYEGLDINTAIEIVVNAFRKSLKIYWKELQ
ncbi:MAG: hypothetical protein BWY26_01145 [Elusimicrobia bacterium ADurb.Bin231]|nr:MAG: hypothetical protein BWY26_01145 [Elusimicrobia bacterium ADurb.Bin231]